MRPSFAPALGIAFLLPALPAQTKPAPPKPALAASKSRDGELCPPGRWYTEGGNAARNAASANAPLIQRPRVAWRLALPGTICGDPLVWGEHVVVALRLTPNRVSIEARRLADGSLLGQRPLNSTTEPVPAMWGNEVVWRVGEGLELLRIGKNSLDYVTRMPAAKSVGAPLRLGTSVFAVVDGKLTCMRAADFRVVWKSSDAGFVGPVSAGDKAAYGIAGSGGRWSVQAFDRTTGTPAGQSPSVAIDGSVSPRVQLVDEHMFVSFGSGHLLKEYRADIELNAVELRLPLQENGPLRPTAIPIPRALGAGVQIGALTATGGIQLGMFPLGSDEGIRLDTCDLHRTIATVPPTIAGNVAYFGACAVDIEERRMLWRLHRDGDKPLPMTRTIPAGRTLLLAAERELIALREDAPADPVAAELTTTWLDKQRQRLTALTDAAMAALDWDLALDLVAQCRELQTDEAWATKREKDIAQKRKDNKKPPDASKAQVVRSAAAAASRAALDDVQQLVATWTTRAPIEQRNALRFLLDQAPDHDATLKSVRALLPSEIQPSEPFLGRDWLDFLEAIAHTKVSWLDAKLEDFGQANLDPLQAQSKQQLLEWRAKWRPDLRALQSDRLLLFSPITQPGSLAKALATGELVCDALESMFATMPKVRQDPRPMLVFIYPDRDEYMAASKQLGIDAEWTAGYYSDSLNELVAKSRMFVPADDTGFASVLPTLAHELTHQWLQDRCPAFNPDRVASRVGPKAFWIVEGFASLVEQFELDLARRQFRFGQGDLQRPDLVASAKAKQLLDWNWLVKANRLDFARLMANPAAIGIPSSVHLGSGFRTRGVDLFYAQSAMLARFLYDAEGGRYKQQLLEFVCAYYTGKSDALDFEKAFGIAAKDLGPKIVEYSRAVVQ